MYIVNGVTADAGWTKQIAFGEDGATWNTLNKANITLKKTVTHGNANSPLVSSADSFAITLLHGTDEILKFQLSDIKNQAGWTLDSAGLQTAIDDISTWISL